MFKLLRRHDKVQAGLKRSRESWFAKMTQIVQRPRLDEALWEDMEELLLSADLGMATTSWLIEKVRDKASAQHLREASEAIELLKEEMISLLSTDDVRGHLGQPPASGGPLSGQDVA